MLRASRSQTMTTTFHATVPLVWSPEKGRFVMDTSRLKLGPNDRIEPYPHELRLEGNTEDGFQLTIGASIVQQS
jgi:hypothetical protein